MDDEELFYQLEQEARYEFKKEFSQEYLKHLSDRSTAESNLVELLWLGFAKGYIRKGEINGE